MKGPTGASRTAGKSHGEEKPQLPATTDCQNHMFVGSYYKALNTNYGLTYKKHSSYYKALNRNYRLTYQKQSFGS